MPSLSVTLLILSPSFIAIIFSAMMVILQCIHHRERDELTKKLMARNLSEYQQEAATKLHYDSKKKESPAAKTQYLSLTELENDPEAFDRATKNIEKNY